MASKIKFDMPDFSLALKNATEKAIEEAGFAIVAEVVQSAPKKETTYVKQVQYIKEQKQVIAAAPYSAVLEYGSRPHIIQPTGGKKLYTLKIKMVIGYLLRLCTILVQNRLQLCVKLR